MWLPWYFPQLQINECLDSNKPRSWHQALKTQGCNSDLMHLLPMWRDSNLRHSSSLGTARDSLLDVVHERTRRFFIHLQIISSKSAWVAVMSKLPCLSVPEQLCGGSQIFWQWMLWNINSRDPERTCSVITDLPKRRRVKPFFKADSKLMPYVVLTHVVLC